MNQEMCEKIMMDLENLRDKVNILVAIATTKDKFTIDINRFALCSGLNSHNIEQIFDIMDEFLNIERRIGNNLESNEHPYSYNDIEAKFAPLGITYQNLKSLFIIFYENNKYLSVIRRYLIMESALGGVAMEYKDMYDVLVLGKK